MVLSHDSARAGSASLLIHAAFLAVLLFLSSRPAPVARVLRSAVSLTAPVFAPRPSKPDDTGGGGGGNELTPAHRGDLPAPVRGPFVPPVQRPLDTEPPLILAAGIDLPPEAPVPPPRFGRWGDPLAQPGPPSNGRGRRGGIGDGDRGGIGDGNNPGYGGGDRGGLRFYRVGGRVTSPALLWKTEPEYSEDARKAKVQGTVVLEIVVDESGVVRTVQVISPMGLGLDEKAVAAVRQWRFRPGRLDGRPVPVQARVEVNFRLL